MEGGLKTVRKYPPENREQLEFFFIQPGPGNEVETWKFSFTGQRNLAVKVYM